MISEIAKNRKCYPIHALSERLTQPLMDNLRSQVVTQCRRLMAMASGFVEKCF